MTVPHCLWSSPSSFTDGSFWTEETAQRAGAHAYHRQGSGFDPRNHTAFQVPLKRALVSPRFLGGGNPKLKKAEQNNQHKPNSNNIPWNDRTHFYNHSFSSGLQNISGFLLV